MRPRWIVAALLPSLVSACQPAPPTFTEAARDSLGEEVRAAMTRLTEAMNAHDVEAVLGSYVDSPDFVYVGCTDPIFGTELFKGVVGPFLANPEVSFTREILRVQVLDPATAVVTLHGGSSLAQGVFTTRVLTREDDGRWRIRHEHESWAGCKEPPPQHFTGGSSQPAEGF